MVRHLRDRRLLGGFALAFCLFFAFIAVFTYLPYRLAAPPFRLSTDAIASAYLVYVAGIAVSPVAGRLAARVAPERLMLAGLAISAAGVAVTLAGSLAVLVAGLLVLVVGMFTAQATRPVVRERDGPRGEGGANALYLAFYYLGGTLGSWLPGPGLAALGLGRRGREQPARALRGGAGGRLPVPAGGRPPATLRGPDAPTRCRRRAGCRAAAPRRRAASGPRARPPGWAGRRAGSWGRARCRARGSPGWRPRG